MESSFEMQSLRGVRVLVTGATGFLGAGLCRKLVADGAVVHGASRMIPAGQQDGIHGWPTDLTEFHQVRSLLDNLRPEIIFHLAGHSVGTRDLREVLPAFHKNAQATVNLLTAAVETGGARVVTSASLEEPEGSDDAPVSPYAASKSVEHVYARLFRQLYGLPIIILRVFMTYGPGQVTLNKLIPHCICSLLMGYAPLVTSGERGVDWVFIDDVVRAFCLAAVTPDSEGRTLDVGTGQLVTVREVVNRLTRMINPAIEPRHGALPERQRERVRVASIGRTDEVLAWKPKITLEEGLARTVRWYDERLRAGELVFPEDHDLAAPGRRYT